MLLILGLFSGDELVRIATTNGIELAMPGRKTGRLKLGQEASFLILGFSPGQSW